MYKKRPPRQITVAQTCIECGKLEPKLGKRKTFYCKDCFSKHLKESQHNYYKQYYPNNLEKIVAVTCIVCGDLVLARNTQKQFCKSCGYNMYKRYSKHDINLIKNWNPDIEMPKHIKKIKTIMDIRLENLESKKYESYR
jgi:ribosomal protein L37E